MSTSPSVREALTNIMEEQPPRRRHASVFEELRQHEKLIKSALKNGWSASQLASRLRKAGIEASVDRMRVEIMKIGGVAPSPRRKSAQKEAA
jgi:hypothetical protein